TVVPNTGTEQGAVVGVPVAAHVAASLMPLTVICNELNALRSAIAPGPAKLLKSTRRKRNRVIGAPVLFTKRRLTDSVPNIAFGNCGVVSRTRFGSAGN